jgi:hypothetical protein
MGRAALTLLASCVLIVPAIAEEHREALAMKVDLDGDAAKVTVAFNYIGKQGDAPTFKGVRLYLYELEAGKGPTRVGWAGREGQQTVVLGGGKYTYYPADMDRRENGTLAVTKAADGRVRLRGVYHAYGKLFVVDEALKPEEPILLEAGK